VSSPTTLSVAAKLPPSPSAYAGLGCHLRCDHNEQSSPATAGVERIASPGAAPTARLRQCCGASAWYASSAGTQRIAYHALPSPRGET
jgi:hypothetical protein